MPAAGVDHLQLAMQCGELKAVYGLVELLRGAGSAAHWTVHTGAAGHKFFASVLLL